MKRTILTVALAISLISYASAQRVLNGDFEKWTTSLVTGQLEPDSFITTEYFAAQQIGGPVPPNIDFTRRTTSKKSGTYAIELNSVDVGGQVIAGFLINCDSVAQLQSNKVGRPYTDTIFPVALHGYYKYATSATDTFAIQVGMSRYNIKSKSRIDFGGGSLLDVVNKSIYTEFFVGLGYDNIDTLPDTAAIYIQSSLNAPVAGTKLTLDELKFVYAFPIFEYQSLTPTAGDDVNFTNRTISTTSVDSIRWNFGYKNGTSTEETPGFNYPVAGKYAVTLTVYCRGDKLKYTDTVTVKAINGVSSLKSNALNIYPNPATTAINITNTPNAVRVEIYDLFGKKVESLQASNSASTEVNIADYKAAMYTVRMYNADNVLTANGRFTVVK